MRQEYAALRAGWGGIAAYDGWFARPLNNAHLVAVAAYAQHVPAFAALLRDQGGDLGSFYAAAAALAALAPEARAARLAELGAEGGPASLEPGVR
jgi:predicted aminopeptidase